MLCKFELKLFQVPAAVEVDKLVKEATKACYDDYLAKMPSVNWVWKKA